MLKRNLPGPFTFILTPLSQVPDKALARRRTLGVRIPDHAVARAVAEALGAPLLVASVHDDCETEYTTDPELIAERYGDRIDLVIDGGPGNSVPTTVVDRERHRSGLRIGNCGALRRGVRPQRAETMRGVDDDERCKTKINTRLWKK